MKKFLAAIWFIVFLFLNQTLLYALMPADGYYPPQSGINQGQSHYYSVFFRGNGEAVVSFRTQFKNSVNYPLSELTYYMSDTPLINDIVIYQRVNYYYPPCYNFQPQLEEVDIPRQNNRMFPVISIFPTPTPASTGQVDQESIAAPCLDQPKYYDGGSHYLKADYQLNGNALKITLPQEVSPSEPVNLIVTYRSLSYVKKDLPGSFTYTFETLKSNTAIDNIQVGISVDQDYILKGAKGEIEYLEGFSESVPSFDSGISINSYNERFDSFYNRIGQGNLYKYASHLAPMESYTVSGSYADSIWKLYLREILFGLLVITTIGLLIVTIVIKILRILTHGMKNTESPKGPFWIRLNVNQKSLLIATFGSMTGATFAVIYTLFLFFFFTKLGDYLSLTNGVEAIFFILIMLISFVLYAAFLFLPSIFISINKGIVWGIVAFISTICWLVLYLIIVFILGSFSSSDNYRSMPYNSSSGMGVSDQYIE